MKHRGFFSIILHGHLPYVRHPEHERFLEEDWFYEAIEETYIPLLQVCERLLADSIDFRLTFTLSPTLVSMFEDPLLRGRARRHLERLIELGHREVTRTRGDATFHPLALMYRQRFGDALDYFDRYGGNLASAFRGIADTGRVEIMTCAATHGFLPLLASRPSSVRAQIRVGVEHHARVFGRPPAGIWLPECGYFPGVEGVLKECGIRHFILDTHGVLDASVRPRYGAYAPILCPNGVAAFGRDPDSSKQVWSAEEGYPGDFDYREFYRDIGWDLPYDYVKDYIQPDGKRKNTGLKYYRITGKSDWKEPYVPAWAREKAALHASNFLFFREKQVEYYASGMRRPPVIVAPYDMELFGHWWYEGPDWLEFLLRKVAGDQDTVKTITPSEALDAFPVAQVSTPSASSWGYKGYNEVWLNGTNDWVWGHVLEASRRMEALARFHETPSPLERRALDQAAREILLLQSSDWPFIMKTGTMVPYARRRVEEHLTRFLALEKAIKDRSLEERAVSRLEMQDNVFPEIDYRVFR